MTFKSTDFLGAIQAHNGETAYNPGDLVYSPNNFQTYRRKTAAGPGVIIANKSFESGTSWWGTPQTGCVIENDTTNARTGSWVYRMSRTLGATATLESTPRVVAFPGQVFRLSGWMKCNALANADARLIVRFARSDGSFISSPWVAFTPAECVSGYVQKTLTATAPALTALISVQIVDAGMTAGSWWADDIDLVQVEPELDSVNWAPISNSGALNLVQRGISSGSTTGSVSIAISAVDPSKCIVSLHGAKGSSNGAEDSVFAPRVVSLTSSTLTVDGCKHYSSGIWYPVPFSWQIAEYR